MRRLHIAGISEADHSHEAPASRPPVAAWAIYALTALAAIFLFLFISGLMPWLGYAEGSSRHGTTGVRMRSGSALGLPAMFLVKGQKAVWDYDVTVEGEDGLILRISKTPPEAGFIVRTLRIEHSGKGRFEVIAPATGLYGFDYELLPQGVLFGPAKPGATRYTLRWGVE